MPNLHPRQPTRTKPRAGALGLVRVVVRQWLVERRLRRRDGSFRSTDRQVMVKTYGAMSAQEFEDINGPQGWLNERVIPRALRQKARTRPWRIVDLGCGSGGSALILARQAPPGSSLVGYDVCARLVERAAARRYSTESGARIDARFVCQSITRRLRDPHGGWLADGGTDVVHSAGIVGHHLELRALHDLVAELNRILAADGVAILDAGPRMTAGRLEAVMAFHGFAVVSRHRLVPFGVRFPLVFRRFDALAGKSAATRAAWRRARMLPGRKPAAVSATTSRESESPRGTCSPARAGRARRA
jgi:SAM-dependent methyltransferase